jgi:hypothetical protein
VNDDKIDSPGRDDVRNNTRIMFVRILVNLRNNTRQKFINTVVITNDSAT